MGCALTHGKNLSSSWLPGFWLSRDVAQPRLRAEQDHIWCSLDPAQLAGYGLISHVISDVYCQNLCANLTSYRLRCILIFSHKGKM